MSLMDIGMDIDTNKKLDKKALLVNKWVTVVMKYETILENETQWLMLEGLLGGKVVSWTFMLQMMFLNGENYGTML